MRHAGNLDQLETEERSEEDREHGRSSSPSTPLLLFYLSDDGAAVVPREAQKVSDYWNPVPAFCQVGWWAVFQPMRMSDWAWIDSGSDNSQSFIIICFRTIVDFLGLFDSLTSFV